MSKINLIVLIFCVAGAASVKLRTFEGRERFNVGTRTLRGGNATVGQFPYQVSLRLKWNSSHICGGSIISNRFILIAAHCIYYYTGLAHELEAIVGAIHLNQGGIAMEISKITPHEKFNWPIIQCDIGLLRTKHVIVFSKTIQPIALPSDQTENTRVIVSGWGNVKVIHSILYISIQWNRTNNLLLLLFEYIYINLHSL